MFVFSMSQQMHTFTIAQKYLAPKPHENALVNLKFLF